MINPASLIEHFCTQDEGNMHLATSLIISKEHKTLYFHIAKTGGSSIVKLLKNNNLCDGVVNNKNLDLDTKTEYFTEVANNWDDYYKFTFVRNKYDLLISLYNYDRRLNGRWSLARSVSFEEFIQNHIKNQDTITKRVQYNNLIDQYYLTRLEDVELFDFTGRFENFNDDLNTVCNRLGIENTEIRVNVGNYDRSKKDQYYTDSLRDNIRTKFPQELKHFGW